MRAVGMILSSVRLSVTLSIVAKQYVLYKQKCLNKLTGSATLGTGICNFQPLHRP